MTSDLEQLAVNTIRALAMDGVEAAESGHPGMPMGMADIAVVLWGRYLRVDPSQPTWPDRDRFVLSNGHGSMLLYSLLHLCSFDMPMQQLQNFRRWGAVTAGHPERDPERGIETTTGPLGQGFGNGVGLAVAEAHLRAEFGPDLVDHRTFAFVSDGDLMEGVASEAASLAGHLELGRLIYLYDDNGISIEGSTRLAFTENVAGRFAAYGWHTLAVDGHDRAALTDAIGQAIAVEDRPSLLLAKTHIAHGAPTKQDTAASHGSPLGAEEVAAAKEAMGWPAEEKFYVPADVYAFFAAAMEDGRRARKAWEGRRDRIFGESPDVAAAWETRHRIEKVLLQVPPFETGSSLATRKASSVAIQAAARQVPALVGGSADLAPSTNTLIDGAGDFSASDRRGRNMHFGIREHGMGAVVNGMALHGGVRPYGATFLVFSDYMRPSVRLSALMGLPTIWIWTHDSVFLGEDGPTHQPIEHLAALRAIPNLWVVRPGDAGETVEAWELALGRSDGPTALILTRQGLPILDRPRGEVGRGGYILRPGADLAVVATGSEVWVALEAAEILGTGGIDARVVSMPCVEAFDAQDSSYRDEVLGGLPVVTVEAGITSGWHRFAGSSGLTIGIDHFGTSAPWQRIAEEWGFTPTAIADRISTWFGG